MAPIKVGFIGLNSNVTGSSYEDTRWAAMAHLNYLKDNGGKYEIVALLNSSKESAEKARKGHGLGDGVKTYGNPEEFAKDPNIDLVVCSVRVDRHYGTSKPSILAGKDVFIEWPLGANLKEGQELLTLANQKNVKTVVGLQAIFSPVVEKVKELVDSGKVGRVLSCTFTATASNGGDTVPEGIRYFVDREVGGNILTIHFAHLIEPILYVLGDFKTWNSQLANQHPFVDVIARDKTIVETGLKKTTVDQILIQGLTTSGAVLSYHLREGAAFPNSPALQWNIYGDKGELRITSPSPFLNLGSDDTKIFFAANGSMDVEEIAVRKDEFEKLAMPGRNIARVYEAFAQGKRGGVGGYRDFEHAVGRLRLIEKMYESWDAQK